MSTDRLVDELRALGREVDVPAVDEDHVASTVLALLPDRRPSLGVRVAALSRRRWSRVVAITIALLVTLALTPPVRAVVADWIEYGGVLIRTGGPPPGATEEPERAQSGLTLAEARELVSFDPVVPDLLGPPAYVEVSDDRRLLSMLWGSGPDAIRLDQFDGQLDPLFAKTLREDAPTYVQLARSDGLWFPTSHALVLLNADGTERTASARSAAPTLVWEVDASTMRLEGADKLYAIRIANSVPSGTG